MIEFCPASVRGRGRVGRAVDLATAAEVAELDRLNAQIESLETRRDLLALRIARRRGFR